LQEDANWQLHDEIPKFERNSKAKIQWDLFELPDGAMAASIATQAPAAHFGCHWLARGRSCLIYLTW